MTALCECGCGQATKLAKRTDPRDGSVRGQPNRFVAGHNKTGRPRTSTSTYLRVLVNGKRKEAHKAIVERAIGHSLPLGAVVHHVNGKRHDNRNRNLVACQDRAYHNLLHQRQRALEGCGHADWLRCAFCAGYSPREEMAVPRGAVHGYHAACRAEYQRRARRKNPSVA